MSVQEFGWGTPSQGSVSREGCGVLGGEFDFHRSGVRLALNAGRRKPESRQSVRPADYGLNDTILPKLSESKAKG